MCNFLRVSCRSRNRCCYIVYCLTLKRTIKRRVLNSIFIHDLLHSIVAHHAIVLMQYMNRHTVRCSMGRICEFSFPYILTFVGNTYPVHRAHYNGLLTFNKKYQSPRRQRINNRTCDSVCNWTPNWWRNIRFKNTNS